MNIDEMRKRAEAWAACEPGSNALNAADVLALIAEVERLRDNERRWSEIRAEIEAERDALKLEVERLRAALNRPRNGILGEACEPAKSAVIAAPASDGC